MIYFALLSLSLSASPISRSKAQTLAKAFLGSDNITEVSFMKESSSLRMASSSDEQIFHAFNRSGGGWVIMAGDDLLSPVLGYSDTGSLGSELPSNMKVYFEGIERNLSKVRNAEVETDETVKTGWTGLEARRTTLRTSSSTGKLLETASWGQESPFNDLCPTNCPTGCVATAMSIVMRYHKWPEHGTGTLDSYTSYKKTISGFSIDDHYYDWDLPLKYTSSWTSAKKSSAATLLYDLGVSVYMQYATDGSGAYSSEIIPALVNHFSYDGSMVEHYRYHYSNAEWLEMIKAEIDAGRPIIYGGSDAEEDAGHQFVVDGYDKNGKVHINWGWSGSANGYFAVNYLGDSSNVGYVFSYWDSGIFGIRKVENQSSMVNVPLFLIANNDYYGITLSSGKPSDKSFSIDVGLVINESEYTDYDGYLRPVLVDSKGNVKEVIGDSNSFKVEHIDDEGYYYYGVTSFNCTISGAIAPGDAVEVQYQQGDGSWEKLPAEPAGDYQDLNVGDSMSTASLGVFDAAYIRFPESMSSGENLYFELIPGWHVPQTVVWYYDNSVKSNNYATLTSGTHKVKAMITNVDGSSETVETSIKVE